MTPEWGRAGHREAGAWLRGSGHPLSNTVSAGNSPRWKVKREKGQNEVARHLAGEQTTSAGTTGKKVTWSGDPGREDQARRGAALGSPQRGRGHGKGPTPSCTGTSGPRRRGRLTPSPPC